MKIEPENIDDIVALVAANFPSFGGNKPANGNPVAAALQGQKPQFAAGVDIKDVVSFTIKLWDNIPKVHPKNLSHTP